MNAVILCFVVGILLLGLEIFMPGAIMGVIGGLALLAGSIVAFQTLGVTEGIIATILAVLTVALTLYLEFVVLPKSAFGKALSVRSPSKPPVADGVAGLIGRSGVTETILAPTGYVVIDGVRHEALSESGLIAKGVTVRVVHTDSFRLTVNSTNKQT